MPGAGPSQDSPDFSRPCGRPQGWSGSTRPAATRAGYDAEHNHCHCREDLGVRQTVIRLNRRNAGQLPLAQNPVPARDATSAPKQIHNQRWLAESGFSQHKRRLGSALTAHGDEAQARELALRVLTHNFMLLAEAA